MIGNTMRFRIAFISALALFVGCQYAAAQFLSSSRTNHPSFVEYQRSLPNPAKAWSKKEDTLRKQFQSKKLNWPAKYIYIRSFKYDSELEVWVKDKATDPFQHFKTYPICALAGYMGPKRIQGDYQVPEGFYYINDFNPQSSYFLSLGLNYPNASDRVLSDSIRPGGEIYIHGSCVTVGCIPITDQQIDELYILASQAFDQGQHFIPVHVFPIRFDVAKSIDYLKGLTKDDPALGRFAKQLEPAYFEFQRTRRLPVVLIGLDGTYSIAKDPNPQATSIH
jgi:murein L,D-transpeptidase YafK